MLEGIPIATVLLDTSVIIEQQKRASLALPVRNALARFTFKGASTYSRLEFKNAWLQRLAYIYSRCYTGEFSNMADFMQRLSSRLGDSRSRSDVSTLLELLAKFLESDSPDLPVGTQILRLKAHCKYAIRASEEAWSLMVTGEFNGTACARAAEKVSIRQNGQIDARIPKCRPDRIECNVHKFFEDHADYFDEIDKRIAEADNPSTQLEQMRQHIQSAKKDSTHLCNRAHCSKLGDAIIALDGMKMETFAANNPAEWELLSSVLQKVLINPTIQTGSDD